MRIRHLSHFIGGNMSKCNACQDDAEYTHEEGHLLIHASGWYSIEELETKLRQLKEANAIFQN